MNSNMAQAICEHHEWIECHYTDTAGNCEYFTQCKKCGKLLNNPVDTQYIETIEPTPSPSQEAEVRAKALVEKFMGGFTIDGRNYITGLEEFEAKGVALICVDEIITTLIKQNPNYEANTYWSPIDYWQQVRTAINQL